MKKSILQLLAVVCCVWAVNAYAKITLDTPPDVPANLNAHEFKELTAKRNDLLTQLGEAQQKIDSQARDCHEVEENSPKVDECRAKANEVRIAVKNYRAALVRFKASLATSVDLQQSKSSMDDKLSMSAKHHPRPIAIESHGVFYIFTPDGRKLSGEEAAHLTEDDEVRLVTGPGGGALLTLVDGTRIKLGSNTEYLTKSADSDTDKGKQPVAELVKGSLRWIHEQSSEAMKVLKETERETRGRLQREGKIRMSTVIMTVRGTEFEGAVLPDGSGHIKLYSGEISVTSRLTGAVVTLMHGQMITFTKDKVGAVIPIPGGV